MNQFKKNDVFKLVSISLLFFTGCSKIDQKVPTKPSKQQRFRDAMQHEFDKTHDPELNEIPSQRLQEALKYYEYVNDASLKSKTSPPFADIEWKERGPNNIGGRTRAILFLSSKKVLAAGVTGGLWVTEDITATNMLWKPVNPFGTATINITCIAQDPTNSNTLYLGTGEKNGSRQVGSGIYKSTDGGVSWSSLASTTFSGPSSNFSYVSKILVASNGDVYAATAGYYCNVNGGLMKSTNGGTNWTRVIGTNGTSCSNGADLTGADLEENNAGDLFFTSANPSGHVYISNKSTHGNNVGNAGNWTDITPTGSWKNIQIGVSKQSNSGVIYAACQGSNSSDVTGIYYSSNKGTNWTSRSVPTICDQGNNSVFTRSQAWYDLVVEIDPANDNTAYFGGIDLLKTTDAGATFSQITTWSNFWPCGGSTPPEVHADHHALIFNPYTANAALSGNDGGLYYSTDMNTSIPNWTSKNDGYNVTQYYAIATHPSTKDIVIGGTQDNGSHLLQFYGTGIGSQISGGDGGFCHILQTNSIYRISSYVYNHYFLETGAGYQSQTASNTQTGRFINPTDLDDANALLFSAGSSNRLEIRSGVTSGTLVRSDYNLGFNNRRLSALKVSPNNNDALYVGDDGGNIYKITNRSGTPTKATWGGNIGANGYISSIDVWESKSGADDSILVTLSNYGTESIFLTSNGTNASPTWVDIDDNNTLQDMPVRWGIFSRESSNKLFIATDLGVMATSAINGNSTPWTLISNNQLPYVRVDMLDYDANDNMVIATHGRGVWETQQPCNLSSPIPTTAGLYSSEISQNDGTYTCFCTAEGELLLAIDTFGSGAKITQDAVALQMEGSGNSTISWNNSGGLITNPNGGSIIDRKWNVSPTIQPTNGPVRMQFSFTNAEYIAIQTACANLTVPTSITTPSQLNIYSFNTGGSFSNPHTTSTGTVLTNGPAPSTTEWAHSTSGSNHVAEFLINSINGGGIGSGANGAVLPVEFIHFFVQRKSKNEALLEWQTATETNNIGYDVERSYDGKEFSEVGWVNASENANQVNNYTYIDQTFNIEADQIFYRLKQLDYDGKFEYSEAKRLNLDSNNDKITLYPNPAKNLLTIHSDFELRKIEIYNLSGKEVIINPITNNTIDISHLNDGTYILKMNKRNGEVIHRRFIKL